MMSIAKPAVCRVPGDTSLVVKSVIFGKFASKVSASAAIAGHSGFLFDVDCRTSLVLLGNMKKDARIHGVPFCFSVSCLSANRLRLSVTGCIAVFLHHIVGDS